MVLMTGELGKDQQCCFVIDTEKRFLPTPIWQYMRLPANIPIHSNHRIPVYHFKTCFLKLHLHGFP